MFITSDTHFFHNTQVKRRGLDSVEEMNEVLIQNWNSIVGSNTVIWHLGDLGWSTHADMWSLISRLNGRIHFIRGNHDRSQILNFIDPLLVSIQDYAVVKYEKQRFVLSHYPFLEWEGYYKGWFHLHGHTHGTIEHLNQGIRRLDVGVDCHNLRPIHFDEVIEKLGGLPYGDMLK